MEQERVNVRGSGTKLMANTEAVECALPEPAFASRAEEVVATFSSGLEQVEELPDGYALRFPGTKEWIGTLVDFVVTERECCPFFAFELRLEPEGGPVWLRLRGDGVKEFLQLVHPLGGLESP